MAEASKVSFLLHKNNIPYIEESKDYAEMGLVPAGAHENRRYQEEKVEFKEIDTAFQDILFDPQSSGGLLYSVPKEEKDAVLEAMDKVGLPTRFACIGEVIAFSEKNIIVD